MFEQFCDAANIGLPFYKSNNGTISEIHTQSIDHFKSFGTIEHDASGRPIRTFNHPSSWKSYPYWYNHYRYNWQGQDGKTYEETKGDNVHIINDELISFDAGWGYVYGFATGEFTRNITNFQGEIVKSAKIRIENAWSNRRWVITTNRTINGRAYKVPVNFETLEPIVDCWAWWGNPDRLRNSRKVQKLILENELEVPKDLSMQRLNFHFFSRKLVLEDLKDYLLNGCECYRCKGFDLFVAAESREPDFSYFNMDYYRTVWSGRHGYYPDVATFFYGCECSHCKRFRKTDNYKYYERAVIRIEIEKILGVDNKTTRGYWNRKSNLKTRYLFMNNDVEIRYTLLNLPRNEAEIWDNLDMFQVDLQYNEIFTRSNFFSGIFSDDVESLRMAIALTHCRCNSIPFQDVFTESERWLNEVWTTQMTPECNCAICERLKLAVSMNLSLFQELMIEPIDARVYPTGLMSQHFHRGWAYNSRDNKNVPWTKDSFIKYFNDYILTGTFCPCDKCQNSLNRMKNEAYLPKDELKTPKCPICGNLVHNKDLIYDCGEVAKRIVEQGKDDLIGVTAALCCGCHGKYVSGHKKRIALCEAPVGSPIIYKDEQGRSHRAIMKYNEEIKEKSIGDILLSEFLNEYDDFQITYVPKVEREDN